ncbi:MAG: DEAD/DEAH box helicase family protein [Deltaproteobacteria bacterium]|nr:DEAD/DEAH box helicase family protein [Deltaproteobacteria bacterium]
MKQIANQIKNRLSLRRPQVESLDILAALCEKLSLQKNAPLEQELAIVRGEYPTCTDFERNFTSLCFALATGVGKTRLMGAFIAYLYLAKGIKNFFVLAPNLTIYNKLIEDFGNPAHPKYVFRGIGAFSQQRPRVITGDNYQQIDPKQTSYLDEIIVNVFNIAKINAEARGGAEPKIKRLSEYIGESYFNYLSELDDLVLLMDESHHYRADRGLQVINELNPILGLELTATPQVERASGTIKFKNVVYEYSLAKAIRDGFVKEPAVATRKNFDPKTYSAEDLDRVKLEDGIRIHEDTKVALEIYARDNRVAQVKPFVLVVAKDTDHAAQLKELMMSQSFFDGRYADKVMEIHSNQRGGEKEENIAQLLTLEDPNNRIEIVIHVNMLKEGWDVTNLYTIIPLRTAASMTLREQTIGRGLRLPYGKRTGELKVDKLTIVAHDRFQEIIDEANKPGSIIRKENIIIIDEQDLSQPKEVITSNTTFNEAFKVEEQKVAAIEDVQKRQEAKTQLEIKRAITEILPEFNAKVKNIQELKRPEIKAIVIEQIKQKMKRAPQGDLFTGDVLQEVEKRYDETVDSFANQVIEIPRISILQSENVKSGFHDFDLDVKNINYPPPSEEIVVRLLRDLDIADDVITGKGRILIQFPENTIVGELINFPEIDYDDQPDLLVKLTRQVLAKMKSYLNEVEISDVLFVHRRDIARLIYLQMMEHFYCEAPAFEKPVVLPFTKIEEHNHSKYTKDKIHDFKETIEPTNAIHSKVFTGFKKACHTSYKFHSKTEKDFAIILEDDKETVVRWLRPAQSQFSIYWNRNESRYQPDFIVEAKDAIYMVETKREIDLEARGAQEKAKAALWYCKHASEFTAQNGGKPWKYILIPHGKVQLNMGFEHLMKQFEYLD